MATYTANRKNMSIIRLFARCLVLWCAVPAFAANQTIETIPKREQQRIWNAVPQQARVKSHPARKVLIWSTPSHLYSRDPHKRYCVPYGLFAMKALGRKTGAFEPIASNDLAMYLPHNLKRFDAIVMNNSCFDWIVPTDADMQRPAFRRYGLDKSAMARLLQQTLLKYVRDGGGIMAFHYAIGANRKWPEFREMLGARLAGHPWNQEIGVRVDVPGHPLVAAFPKSGFRIHDEIYQFVAPYSRKKLLVLLSLDIHTVNMNVQSIQRTDGDFALAWIKPYGKGRIFYTAFGHRTELYWNSRLLQFYLNGIQFATGDLKTPLRH